MGNTRDIQTIIGFLSEHIMYDQACYAVSIVRVCKCMCKNSFVSTDLGATLFYLSNYIIIILRYADLWDICC